MNYTESLSSTKWDDSTFLTGLVWGLNESTFVRILPHVWHRVGAQKGVVPLPPSLWGPLHQWTVVPDHQRCHWAVKLAKRENQRFEESTNSITSPWAIKTGWHITIHRLFSRGVPWWQEKLSPASLSSPSQIESSQRDCKSIPNISSCLSYVPPELRRWL